MADRDVTRIAGLLSVLLIVAIEVVVWSNAGDAAKIKAFRFHLFCLIEFIIAICVRYIWRRLCHLIHPLPKHLRLSLQALMTILLGLSLINVPASLLLSGAEPKLLVLVSNQCFGTVAMLTFSLLLLDVLCFVAVRTVLYRNSRLACTKVRTILSLIIGGVLVVMGVVTANSIDVDHVTVPIKGLHPRLNGTTIVQLSDVHLGPFIGRSSMERLVAMANQLNGDVVVVTGDLVDASVEILWDAVVPIAHLTSKYGVYYCTGNHEYYTGDVDNWIKDLPQLNVRPLINERVCLFSEADTCTGGVYLAGLEDYDTRKIKYGTHSVDIHKALTGREVGVATIVLAHQPKGAAEAIQWPDVQLVLSGHTHAGQVVPFIPVIYLFNPYFSGLYQPLPGVYVYVSPGVHYYHLPLRHYTPSITRITLTTASP